MQDPSKAQSPRRRVQPRISTRSDGRSRVDNLTGVDLSPHDIEEAAQRVPRATFVHASAIDFLSSHEAAFDVVVARAILEHTPKAEVLPFLSAAAHALRPGGVAIVDVPNMDWLFAGHERYMDFTHEVGFTRESLAQVMDGLV